MLNANAGRLMVVLGADIRDYRRKMKQAENDMRTRTGNMERTQSRFVSKMQLGLAGAAVALGAFTIKSVQAWNQLNESMANVATLIPGNIDRVKELRRSVQDLSVTFGKTTEDIASGLYQTISAFQDSADTIDLLRIGAETAMAGVATTREALNLLIPVTKGYGDVSKEAAEKASDLAFMTVKLGVTTIPELARSMGRVAPIAKKVGVELEELFAIYSTLTGATGDTALVTTQVLGIMNAMLKPTDAMTAAMNELGYSSVRVMISELGLVNALGLLLKTTDGTEEALVEMFQNRRALPGVFQLAGQGVKEFHTELLEMYSSSGARKKALKEQTDGVNAFGFALKKAGRAGLVAMQEIGRGFMWAADKWTKANIGGMMAAMTGKRAVPPQAGRGGVAPETMLYGVGAPGGAITAEMAAERIARKTAEAEAQARRLAATVNRDVKPAFIDTAAQAEKWSKSLTSINMTMQEIPDLVVMTAEGMADISRQASEWAAHVTEGVYIMFDAMAAEDFWGTLWRQTRRYFQMLIAESIRSRAYAWFVDQFSWGQAKVLHGNIIPAGPPSFDNSAPLSMPGGSTTINLINNSGMPLDATASMGAGGDLTVVLEGPFKKLLNSGRMDGTMKQFNAYRTVG